MDNNLPAHPPTDGMLFRLNAGFGFRLTGDDAQNDGILADIEVGYRSERFGDLFSIETGSTLDAFGETAHLSGFFLFNVHPHRYWIFSLRSMAGGVQDDRETPTNSGTTATGDGEDLGGIFELGLKAEYRLDSHVFLGLRSAVNVQHYGDEDQGTQWGLANFLSFTLLR